MSSPSRPRPEEAQLTGEQVTSPLTVVNGYPFIEGAINGRPGKLLFDTGQEIGLLINTHVVMPPNGSIIGHGVFGSGQTYDVLQFPEVDELRLPHGLHFTNLKYILGYSGEFFEKGITPDYIGALGVDFFKGYVFKLDYDAPSVIFYPSNGNDAGRNRAEVGEKVVQTISLDTKGHRNQPTFPITISGAQAIAKLDTGAHTTIAITPRQLAVMRKAGTLRRKGDGYILSGVVINGYRIPAMLTNTTSGEDPVAKELPASSLPLLTLGYEVLSQYKTVWDLEGGTLTLLAPAVHAHASR